MTPDEIDDAIEIFEERAAVREYEAGLPRINAESAALREVVDARGKPVAREVHRYREMRRNHEYLGSTR